MPATLLLTLLTVVSGLRVDISRWVLDTTSSKDSCSRTSIRGVMSLSRATASRSSEDGRFGDEKLSLSSDICSPFRLMQQFQFAISRDNLKLSSWRICLPLKFQRLHCILYKEDLLLSQMNDHDPQRESFHYYFLDISHKVLLAY